MTLYVVVHWNRLHLWPRAEIGERCFYIQAFGLMFFVSRPK